MKILGGYSNMEELKLKSRGTSTRNIAEIISKNYVQIVNAEYLYQSPTGESQPLDKDTFVKSLLALSKAGIFADLVEWRYEEIYPYSDLEDFLIYGNLHDPYCGTKITVSLLVEDGTEIEDVVTILRKNIFNELTGKRNKHCKVINLADKND